MALRFRGLAPKKFIAATMASEASSPVWKKRSVVSSFLFDLGSCPGEAEGTTTRKTRVALFQRSSQVSTYQHHLAPISGTIEETDPSPLQAALREIKEETTLASPAIELMRRGKPYTFRDDEIHREWTVHPFAFRLRSPEDAGLITIDWEHEAWDWYDPDTAVQEPDAGGSLGSALGGVVKGVPRLADSLRRVWFDTDLGNKAGGILARGLDKLATDQESGARDLASKAVETLRDVIQALDYTISSPKDIVDESEWWWIRVRMAAWHLVKNGRESMGAAILSAIIATLAEIEPMFHNEANQGLEHLRIAGVACVKRCLNTRHLNGTGHIDLAFREYLNTNFSHKRGPGKNLTVLTLSSSSTIRDGLLSAHLDGNPSRYNLDIRVLESRPLFEGVSMAGTLAELLAHSPHADDTPPKITIFSDASAALAAEGVDLVLIGADRIAASGAVSNKTGTLPAVLSARFVTNGSAKVVVVSDTDKIAMPGETKDHVVEDNDPAQLSHAWKDERNSARVQEAAAELEEVRAAVGGGGGGDGKNRPEVVIRNVFFEWCPPQLIDTYITEKGEMGVDGIRGISDKISRDEDKYFRDL
ncbi:hypothetical protein B0H63DRAFT_474895 [Podospora didyma]|uniref:Nudix hydrolase domain-containing protein n=1 Tax=Podospora didyma TaxID=330526 RepID=A0AAE0TVI0_9PEZI|nr:hypothetical protein B0H63DRAFT_474895 [Podospora didyma]